MPDVDPTEPITLDQVLTPVDREYVEKSFYAACERLGVDTSQWIEGYYMHAFVRGASIMLAGMSQLVSYIGRGQFLDTADTEGLRLKAHYDYGVDYNPASFAQGTVRLENTGAGAYTFAADELVLSSTVTRKNYRVSDAFTLDAGATLTLPVLALEAGTASNVPPSTTDTEWVPVTPLSPDVVITNPASIAGTDDESNEALKRRSRQSVALLSPANPHGAYEAAVFGSKRLDGTPIGVTRAVALPDGYGRIDVYVAGSAGPIADADDIARLNDIVQKQVEPLSVRAVVSSAVQVTIPVTATVYHNAFLTSTELTSKLQAALLALAARQKIGGERTGVMDGSNGSIYRDQIIVALGSADPSIYHVVVTSPADVTSIPPNAFPVFEPVSLTVIP